jgi:hypothetical protein
MLLAAVLLACGNVAAGKPALAGAEATGLAAAPPPPPPVAPPPGSPAEPEGGIVWNDNFFGPCRGDCAISVYGGGEVTTSMERIFFLKYPPRPIWTWHWRNSGIIAGTFSRQLVSLWGSVSIEPEFGIGQRFGDMRATESWAALAFRWTNFPWNRYVKTTIGVAEGLSMTTQVDTQERLQNQYKVVDHRLVFTGSDLLNFFTPEVTFALPQYPAYEVLFRFQHRSGIFGLINGVHAGAQFFTAGFRVYF